MTIRKYEICWNALEAVDRWYWMNNYYKGMRLAEVFSTRDPNWAVYVYVWDDTSVSEVTDPHLIDPIAEGNYRYIDVIALKARAIARVDRLLREDV